MWVLSEIRAAIAEQRVPADELPQEDTLEHARKLDAKFATPGSGPLWERLRDTAARQDSEGWRAIHEFVEGECILLVEDAQGRCAFRFKDPGDLVRVLAACSGFSFYVADATLDCVVAFNDHDVLIGAGSARDKLAVRSDRADRRRSD